MGGKAGLRCKSKTLMDVVNKLFTLESLLTKPSTKPSNVLPEKLKQKFKCSRLLEGDGIESRLPFKIFFTLNSVISIIFLKKKFLVQITYANSWRFELSVVHSNDCNHHFFRIHKTIRDRRISLKSPDHLVSSLTITS